MLRAGEVAGRQWGATPGVSKMSWLGSPGADGGGGQGFEGV